jgi:nicotinamidase-related amidase
MIDPIAPSLAGPSLQIDRRRQQARGVGASLVECPCTAGKDGVYADPVATADRPRLPSAAAWKEIEMTSRTALLVMDAQVGVVARFADDPAYLERMARAMEAARAAGILVVFVRVAFRPGFPEVSSKNKTFSTLVASGQARFGEDDAATQIHPTLAPQNDDLVVTKRRVSAFSGSDLDVVLRSAGIDSLVLAGIATSGVVLSTTREAADRDYRLVVLSDGCLDADQEVHRVLIEKVFPRQAEVMTVAGWVATTAGQQSGLSHVQDR